MSIKALQEYTRFAKYARFIPELKRRETWDEQVKRVFDMHRKKLGTEICEKINEDIEFAERMMLQKRILGSQRALQFGGDPILIKNGRLYNCSASYADRPRFFQEAMWLLLCGCGVGLSVQKHHVAKLPKIKARTNEIKKYTIPDSIEGWADAVGVLLSSYFDSNKTPFPEYKGKKVDIDYSLIRPSGSPLSSGGKAPGPDGLRKSLETIERFMDKLCKYKDKLAPIDVCDVVMHCSDAVLSGGVRRSACLTLFSSDDEEMMKAKTGSWFIDNPQRGRSNNSALLLREKTTKEEFLKIFESVKEFGEPGFIWSDDTETMFNPCVEISGVPKLKLNKELREKFKDDVVIQNNDKELSGWFLCNLCEINVKKAKTEEEFMDACRAAAILGTIQASYTSFEYLGPVSEEIVRMESLLGVSINGMADNPEISFDPSIQKKGAKKILEINEEIAKKIGINKASRTTCLKPSGTSSCLLGTASGIHPHHAKRYFRRVQANKIETSLQFFQKFNPHAVEQSVWSTHKTDMIITFLCEVPDGTKTKNQTNALSLLENVRLTQQNWVEYGTRDDQPYPTVRHNVSNTINVQPEEWDEVANYIYKNRKWFAGISLLPVSGDMDYPQAPFTAVLTPTEIVREYGDGSIMASGLIVDGLRAFDNNLWAASDCVLGIGEITDVNVLREKIRKDCEENGENWKSEGLSPKSPDKLLIAWLEHNVKNYNDKIDWIRRAKQFASRYFSDDVRKMTYCLKQVGNWKTWCDLSREYKDVDWTKCYEDEKGNLQDFGGEGGAGGACASGTCDLNAIGIEIQEKVRSKRAMAKKEEEKEKEKEEVLKI